MPHRQTSNPSDSRWQPDSPEARILAGLLRHTRFTFLLSPDGQRASQLLLDGVMPQLRRRAGDRAALSTPSSAVVVPFPDRRHRDKRGPVRRDGEVAIWFDRWVDAPLPTLNRQLRDAIGAPDAQQVGWASSFGDGLVALHRRYGLRMLVVLHGFEACLGVAEQRSAAHEFVEQWIDAVERADVPANFLITMHERSAELLAPLRSRLSGLDEHTVRLEGQGVSQRLAPIALASAAASSHDETTPRQQPLEGEAFLASLDAMVAKAAAQAAQDGHAPVGDGLYGDAPSAERGRPEDDAFLASLADISNRVSGQSKASPSAPRTATPAVVTPLKVERSSADSTGKRPLVRPAESSTPEDTLPLTYRHRSEGMSVTSPAAPIADTPLFEGDAMFADTEVAASADTAPTDDDASATARSERKAGGRLAYLAIPAAVTAAIALWIWPKSPSTVATTIDPVAPAMSASASIAAVASAAVPAPAPLRTVSLALDGMEGEARIAQQWLQHRAPGSTVAWQAVPSRGGLQGLLDVAAGSTHASPALMLTTHDVLQAARRLKTPPALQVVAPLFTQEVLVIVRADSPLQYIHDIRGARINSGALGSRRDLTARGLYRAMFGEPLPQTEGALTHEDTALAELIAFRTLDAIVLVGNESLAWLAGMPDETRRSLKLLKLDPDHAEDRRALLIYARSTLSEMALGQQTSPTETFSVMTYLVARATDDAVGDERISDVAISLCAALPTLHREGHAKWKDVRAADTPDVGWPYAHAARAALATCPS